MKNKRILKIFVAVLLLTSLVFQGANACTIFAVGKDASTDGSTMVSHTCDSTGDDTRLWIIPAMEGGEGVMRDIVIDGNRYGDWSDYPNVKDYGAGTLIGEMPQPDDTYQYLHSNYSLINELGVAMGESTCGISRDTEYGLKIRELLFGKNDGLIDAYHAQHIGLERATTAREAVEIMGKLVDDYGWRATGEIFNICDGDEVWVMELYGLDLWCAVKIPDNAVYVGCNRMRIMEIDFDDPENFMWSANLKPFAIENELWEEGSDIPFAPAELYGPNTARGCVMREWRALDLLAPSLNLEFSVDNRYPLYVVPEKKLSVNDVMLLNSDYYQGTEYDLSLEPEAGPYGDPLTEFHVNRPINMYRATYQTIANVKSWLPNEAKCLLWHGLGAADSSYLIPLFASMTRLPASLSTGTRYEAFNRDSAWWVNSYVQQTATTNYQSAILDIHAARDGRMSSQYATVEQIQKVAAELIKAGNTDAAVELLTAYAYNNAVDWHQYWLKFGDELYGKYMFGRINMKQAPQPEWWKEIMDAAPRNPGVPAK